MKASPREDSLAENSSDEDDDPRGLLVNNQKRCDLWTTAAGGNTGNARYQCERAAKTQRRRGNLKVAGDLDGWANNALLCESLADPLIMKATPEQVRKGVTVLLDEYDGAVPA